MTRLQCSALLAFAASHPSAHCWPPIADSLFRFGMERNNLLPHDQARAGLLPHLANELSDGEVQLSYAWSPFVGEWDAVNVLARDQAGTLRGGECLLANEITETGE